MDVLHICRYTDNRFLTQSVCCSMSMEDCESAMSKIGGYKFMAVS